MSTVETKSYYNPKFSKQLWQSQRVMCGWKWVGDESVSLEQAINTRKSHLDLIQNPETKKELCADLVANASKSLEKNHSTASFEALHHIFATLRLTDHAINLHLNGERLQQLKPKIEECFETGKTVIQSIFSEVKNQAGNQFRQFMDRAKSIAEPWITEKSELGKTIGLDQAA